MERSNLVSLTIIFLMLLFICFIMSLLSILFASEVIRNVSVYDHATDSSQVIYFNSTLDGDHSYLVEVKFSSSGWITANVNGSVSIYLDGVSVLSANLSAVNYHKKRAYAVAVVDHELDVNRSSSLVVYGSFIAGDYWEITLYQDLPSFASSPESMIPDLFLISVYFAILLTYCVQRFDVPEG